MSVSLKLIGDGSIAFSGASGGAGSWADTTLIGAIGGTYKKATVVGDKVTITWTGRSLYLVIGQDYNGADFTITTDGVTRSIQSTYAERTDMMANVGYCRVPILAERNLADVQHVTVIQSITSDTRTVSYFNGYIAVTGAKIVPGVDDTLVVCGDSWSEGSGAFTKSACFVNRLHRSLRAYRSKEITLVNLAIPGSGLTSNAKATVSLNTALQNVILAANSQPTWLLFQYGVNDLISGNNFNNAGQWSEYYRTILTLVQDVFDTTKVKVFVGTPGYVNSYILLNYLQYNGSTSNNTNFNFGHTTYHNAVELARKLPAQFGYKLVDVYRVMNRRSELVYPNSAPDFGLHPNNEGHGVIADAYMEAILSA